MERRNPFGPPVTEPFPDCQKCAELADKRAAFRLEFNHSKVTDINVLLGRHQERDHGRVNVA